MENVLNVSGREYRGESGARDFVRENSVYTTVNNVEAVRVIGGDVNYYAFIMDLQAANELETRKALFRLDTRTRSTSAFALDQGFQLESLTPFERRKMFYFLENCRYRSDNRRFTLNDNELVNAFGNIKKPSNIRLFTWAGGCVFAWHDGERAQFVFVDDTEEKRGEAVFCRDELTEDNILLWRVENFERLGNGVNVGPGEMSIRLKSVIFPNK